MTKKKKKGGKAVLSKSQREKMHHWLYEESVQNVDESIDKMRRLYRRRYHRTPRLMREDFCGTALLACEWARRHRDNRAWGIDLDAPTLEWGRKRHLEPLGKAAERVTLVEADVRVPRDPKVEVINAYNFSYCVFKDRPTLRSYFKAVHDSLLDEGMFILDLFGGTEAVTTNRETRKIDAFTAPDGTKIPRFTYIWEHEHYNVVTHDILCHIHFKVRGYRKWEKAFTYDWRLWTLPEVRELLLEAGFSDCGIYIHGWTNDGESDENYRLRTNYENAEGWIAYVVGWK
jgi:SAM-dependent methyltransferase